MYYYFYSHEQVELDFKNIFKKNDFSVTYQNLTSRASFLRHHFALAQQLYSQSKRSTIEKEINFSNESFN